MAAKKKGTTIKAKNASKATDLRMKEKSIKRILKARGGKKKK